MKYYITKKEDTIDSILNRFGITYQTFVSLNNLDVKKGIQEGVKIRIPDHSNERSFKENISKLYQDNTKINNEENKIICPYCKNIIIIPNNKL